MMTKKKLNKVSNSTRFGSCLQLNNNNSNNKDNNNNNDNNKLSKQKNIKIKFSDFFQHFFAKKGKFYGITAFS